jgi:hypothetical protein
MKSFLWRLSIPAIIILLALFAFKRGVVVAYQPELGKQPVNILIFHIISFFTFGAKDYGPPIGGPMFWQYVIYFVYYAAPLNFLSVVAEALYLLSKPLIPILLHNKEHYLIIGYGRVGKAAADFLHQKDNKSRIVILDKVDIHHVNQMNFFKWKYLFLKRDVTDPNALHGLDFKHCKGVYLLTDNEWLNIKLYYEIKTKLEFQNKDVHIFTRITSVDLMAHLNDSMKINNRPNDKFFNVHTAASRQLFEDVKINDSLKEEFNLFNQWREKGIETVIFFGFGRFGSEFLNQMQLDPVLQKTLKNIVIVDPVANESWKYFQINHRYELNIKSKLINAGMENITLLESAFSAIDYGHTLAVFSCDNDVLNIKHATIFHKIYDKNDFLHYVLRTKNRLKFSNEILDNFIGKNYLVVPTFEWIKAYFEDEHYEMYKDSN